MKNCILFVLAAATLVFAATGCSGKGNNSNPTGSASTDPTYDTPLPYGGQGNPNPGGGSSESGGSSGSGGSSASSGGGVNLPQGKGDVAMIIIAAIILLIGVYLVKEGNIRWGVPLLIAGLGLVVWRIGIHGLGANFAPWSWHLVVWVLILAWTISKVTGFTKLDDWVVTGGSLVMLVMSFVGRGVLGSWNPFSSAWWILECIWVFLVAEAIWKSDYFKARRFAQFLALAGGWYILGVLS